MSWLEISNLFLWILMLIQFAFMFLLARLVANFLNRFRLVGNKVEKKMLKIGDHAPLFRAKDQNGNLLTLVDNSGKGNLLLFVSNTCPICHSILSNLPNLDINVKSKRILVVSFGELDIVNTTDYHGIHFINSKQIFDMYNIEKVPFMMLADEEGIIIDFDQVRNFDHFNNIIQSSNIKAS